MKKITLFLLTIIMIMGLAACGSKTSSAGENQTNGVQTDTQVTQGSKSRLKYRLWNLSLRQ